MGKQIGHLDWNACLACMHYSEVFGGCDLDVPESIEMMELNGDSIECNHYEKAE